MQKLLGFLFLINTLIVCVYLARDGMDAKKLTVIAMAGLFTGVFLLVVDRMTAFKSPIGEITTIVESARTDAEAVTKIRSDVEGQRETIALIAQSANRSFELVKELEAALTGAKEELSELADLQEYQKLLLAACNGERAPFEKIRSMRTGADPQEVQRIEADLIRIVMTINNSFTVRFDMPIPWSRLPFTKEDMRPENFGVQYAQLSRFHKQQFLSLVWESEHFSRFQKLDIMAEVLEKDNSLFAMDRACSLLDQECKLGMTFLAYELYVDWWKKNKIPYLEADQEARTTTLTKGS